LGTRGLEPCMRWPIDDRFWTVKDVARYLQASESWVRHAANAGKLPYLKIGGLLRFDPAAIRDLVEKPPVTGTG